MRSVEQLLRVLGVVTLVLVLVLVVGVAGCGDVVVNEADTSLPDSSVTVGEVSTCEAHQDCDAFAACLDGTCVDNDCIYTLRPNTCFIDEACYQAGQEEPGNRCQVCDPDAIATAFINKSCDDGSTCDDVSGDCVPSGKVTVGSPCTSTDECVEGACIPMANGDSICGGTCSGDGDCPAGLTCGSGGLCVDPTSHLCRPCTSDADCESPGVEGSRCVDFAGSFGSFCGVACSVDADCPADYGCTDLDGAGLQCTPNDDACECNDLAIADHAQTVCGVGVCNGTRRCEAGGLSACSGSQGTDETCDGVDNDCDGDTDEDWRDADGVLNTSDHCGVCNNGCDGAIANGSAICVVTAGSAACELTFCDAGYEESLSGVCTPLAAVEQCEVCVTIADCDPGLTCETIGTDTFCVAACSDPGSCDNGYSCEDIGATSVCLLETGGCAASGKTCTDASECEDLDPCTTGDCVADSCVFQAVDCSAEDDACATGQCQDGGCVAVPNGPDGTACDDNDVCTSTDVCTGGVCSGTPMDCSSLDDTCVSGTCQDGSCLPVALPCGVTSVRVHYPTAAAVAAPLVAPGTAGYCGSFGHSHGVGVKAGGNGWSVKLGFIPGVVTP